MLEELTQGHPGLAVVAFIGLGNMGTPMTRRLLDAGHRVVGFDLSETAMARFTTSGGTSAATPEAAAAQADVVILMLPNSDIVESVVTTGVAAAMRPDALLVDMSSSEPMRTRALAEKVRFEHDIELVDAPRIRWSTRRTQRQIGDHGRRKRCGRTSPHIDSRIDGQTDSCRHSRLRSCTQSPEQLVVGHPLDDHQ